MLIRLGSIAALAFVLVAAIIAFRTADWHPETLAAQLKPPPPTDRPAVERLSAAIRIPTISPESGPAADAAFDAFMDYLALSYPRVHDSLKREVVGRHSLLFSWPGTAPDAPAILLAAHQDVVPIAPGSERDWRYPPFSGTISGGFVWGRGTIDDKASLIAIMEAVERQLAKGFRPSRTIYLAFGHDEERGGTSGALAIAELMERRGTKIGLVLDEGGAVTDGIIRGTKRPIAIVGTAEKGYLSVELVSTGPGGHSSMPGTNNPAARIARAVDRLAESPFPAHIGGVTGQMLDALAPHTSGATRIALSNRWLFDPLIKRQLLQNAEGTASIRTTTTPTIIVSGTKDNVLPQVARATINHRIAPGETVSSVLTRDRRTIDDPNVIVKPTLSAFNPSRVTKLDTPQFAFLKRSIQQSFPNAAVVPSLSVGATDGRHYDRVSGSVLRFFPVVMTRADVARAHGTNERIGIGDFMRAIDFYERLIEDSALCCRKSLPVH